jgi:hypothetical protein
MVQYLHFRILKFPLIIGFLADFFLSAPPSGLLPANHPCTKNGHVNRDIIGPSMNWDLTNYRDRVRQIIGIGICYGTLNQESQFDGENE